MNPEYYSVTFDTEGFNHEIWMAMLSEWPFESFQEDGNRIIGYIQKHDITESMLVFIEKGRNTWFKEYHLDQVEEKNWNEVWESSFNPVAVDDYCYIRASFHTAPEGRFKHEVIIAPRMAFGTGHHATTYMMLQAMSKLDFNGKNVLDFGCGTGILSVVAAQEGASSVIGTDIQPEAIENSIEHAALNGVNDKCHFSDTSLESISDTFDIILANINRSVIKEYLHSLKKMLKPGGRFLISGIMAHERSLITDMLTSENLQILSINDKDAWLQITL